MIRRNFVYSLGLFPLAGCNGPEQSSASSLQALLGADCRRLGGKAGVVVKTLFTEGDDLFSLNASAKFPSGSLAKLVVAVCIADMVASGTLDMHAPVKVTEPALAAKSSFIHDRHAGETLPLWHLLELMLSQSDSFCANVLITYAGLDRIHKTIRKYDLRETNIAGLYISAPERHITPHSFTSARDITTLMAIITTCARSHDNHVSSIYNRVMHYLLNQYDRAGIPAGIPAADQVANKTGGIEGALGDSAIVAPYGRKPLIVTILVKDSSDAWASTFAMRRIACDAYRYTYLR